MGLYLLLFGKRGSAEVCLCLPWSPIDGNYRNLSLQFGLVATASSEHMDVWIHAFHVHKSQNWLSLHINTRAPLKLSTFVGCSASDPRQEGCQIRELISPFRLFQGTVSSTYREPTEIR